MTTAGLKTRYRSRAPFGGAAMTHATMPLAIAMFLELSGREITFGKEAATVQIDMVMKA